MTIANSASRALILPGGGARAAYQVGVIKAISDLLPDQEATPFRVYSGISAGAINATVLASNSVNFKQGVSVLEDVWKNFKVNQVYRTENGLSLKNAMRWMLTVISAGRMQKQPMSILDNQPLRELLTKKINLAGIQEGIDKDVLDGLVVICSAYYSALSVHFFQGNKRYAPWHRLRRTSKATKISIEHLMASAAIPYIFPAVYVDDQFYADGAVRQSRPLSSVLNMDASRLLVIGVRDEQGTPFTGEETNYPSLGKIAGYVLDTLFMDGMFHDLETVMNVNDLINELKKQAKGDEANFEDKRLVSTHIIVPSEDIRDMVIKHRQRLPRNVRLLLSGKDDEQKSGGQLMSYLLFDSAYTKELMDLGYRDAMQQKDKLYDFFCADEIPELIAPSHIKHWFI